MEEIVSHSLCTGCGACAAVCPKSCITLAEDRAGFLYPTVDASRCVNCGLCQQVCPEQNGIETANTDSPACYVGWTKSDATRFASASGGAFAEFAKYYLNQNGIVYGAAYDSNFNLSYVQIQTLSELPRIQSSKYCQSHIGDGLQKISNLLENGKPVLFGGTACQIAGLQSYLKKQRVGTDNLLCCGLICHGVAPNKLLKDFIKFLETQYNERLDSLNLRSKKSDTTTDSNASALTSALGFANRNDVLLKFNENPYMQGFIKALCYRENCYTCRYAQLPRIEDITLGDYFEADKKDIDDLRKGVSVILLHNAKALQFFERVKSELHYTSIPINQVVARKRNLTHPSIKHKSRDAFIVDYTNKGFDYVEKKYLRYRPLKAFIEQKIDHARGILSKIKKKLLH